MCHEYGSPTATTQALPLWGVPRLRGVDSLGSCVSHVGNKMLGFTHSGFTSILLLSLSSAGCGSMYAYYGANDAASLRTNSKITAMDTDTRTRQAATFYIEPGSRVISFRAEGKGNGQRDEVLVLKALPKHRYRVDLTASAAGNVERTVSVRGASSTATYRWCDESLVCKANEPFDHCVRRHCP